MEIAPQRLTREAFAPFGDVIEVPTVAGRNYYADALGNFGRFACRAGAADDHASAQSKRTWSAAGPRSMKPQTSGGG